MNSRPTMFVGSSSEGLEIARAMHYNLRNDLEVTVWPDDVFKPTKGTLESLAEAVNRFDFATFVLSGEDAAIIRKQKLPVVRDNVVLEAGMFIGRLGRDRVFLVVPSELPGDEKLHLPTDLLGTTTLDYEAMRSDDNWKAATSPACGDIKTAVKKLGGVKASKGIIAYGDHVVLTTFDGSYIQIGSDERGTLTATSRDLGQWDRFEVVSATGALTGRSVKFGDKIGLKATKNNKYVSADFNEGQGKSVGAWISKLDPWEIFVVRPASPRWVLGDIVPFGTSFALFAGAEDKNVEAGYIAYRPDDTKTFWAAATSIQGWERLMFVEPE